MKKLFVLIAFFVWWKPTFAQQEIPLYDGVAPGSEDWTWTEGVITGGPADDSLLYNVVEPTLTAYLPPYYLATGTAMIVAPGGAFHILSMKNEGIAVAQWLNSKGIAAFVLKYRLARSYTDDPIKELRGKMSDFNVLDSVNAPLIPLAMADGLQAVEYVRNNASTFDVNPEKIGFMGFSAGGTLTMSVVYNGDDHNRPNFVAPIYAYEPAIIGSTVPQDTTPIFVTVAADDQLGMVPYSLNIYEKWFQSGQPAELHVYQQGGHGFGMRKQGLPTDTWYERFRDWLQLQGYLKKLYPNKYEKLNGEEEEARRKIERIYQMAEDFGNLARYRSANAELTNPEPEDNRVVFLGNSITEGWARTDPDFFTAHNFVGRGISGQTSAQLLLRFRQDVIDLHPKAVVIHIGTNDVAENTGPFDPDFTMGNIRSMVELAHANGIKVILAAVLPSTRFEWNRALGDRSDMILDLNLRIHAFAEAASIPFVDYHTALRNDRNGMDPDLAEDGVHPTPKGFGIMQNLVLPVIERILEE